MSKSSIRAIHAHEILDSRGNPTISVSVMLDSGIVGSASVPSGASTGIHEALELRDGDKKRYGGKGVLKAVANVGKIEKKLVGMNVLHQEDIDGTMRLMDGTKNKSKLGANAILGVSLACAHAGAKHKQMPLYEYIRWVFDLHVDRFKLPYPMMNIMNGGAHAGWILDIQEYMLMPLQKMLKDRVRAGSEIFHALGSLLKEKGFSTLVGDEGGYSAPLKSNEEVFKLLAQAAKKAGYKPGVDVNFAIDAAASEFYDKKSNKYVLKRDKKKLTAKELSKWYRSLVKKYPLVSIEDPFDQDDWDAWVEYMKDSSGEMVVGDDLYVTNTERLQRGIDMNAANSILIKLNQIGSLTETVHAILLAQAYDYSVVISHRSGETADTTIADLAVGVGAEYIKTGSLSRSERVAKYNRLMEIEEELRSR